MARVPRWLVWYLGWLLGCCYAVASVLGLLLGCCYAVAMVHEVVTWGGCSCCYVI